MQNNRRSFIKLVALSVGALAFPVKGTFAKIAKHRVLTIADIMAICYPVYIKDNITKDSPFFSPVLNAMVKDGRIKLVPFADSVEKINYNGSITRYDVENFHVPHTWTREDDRQNPTERERVTLAVQLMRNGTELQDWHFEEMLKDHDLIMSTDCRYNVGAVYEVPNQRAHYMLLSTVYAKLPKGTLTRSS